jgi:hypothetical protein
MQAVEQREKSLAEQIVVITLVAVMMAVFIWFFFKNEKSVVDTGFRHLQGQFSSQVSLIHSQWILSGKPVQLTMKLSLNDNSHHSQPIYVNKQGWVTSLDDQLMCEDIWRQVMGIPLVYMKQPISAISVERIVVSEQQKMVKEKICRYSIVNGTYFEYNPLTGKINN